MIGGGGGSFGKWGSLGMRRPQGLRFLCPGALLFLAWLCRTAPTALLPYCPSRKPTVGIHGAYGAS